MNNYLLLCNEARIAFVNKNFSYALQIYNNIIKVFPHSKIYSNRGIIHLHLGYIQNALDDFDIALHLDPWNATAYYSKMDIYHLLKMQNIAKEKWHLFEECRGEFEKYAAVDLYYVHKIPRNVNVESAAAAELAAEPAPAPKEKEETANIQITITENNSVSESNSSIIEQVQEPEPEPDTNAIIQQLKETEENEEKMRYNHIEVIPEWKQLVIAGNINVNNGKYKEALPFYNQVIEKYPDCYDGYLGRGTVYAIDGKIEESLVDLNRAIEIKPNNPDAYRRRFQIYLSQKKVVETIGDLSKILELCPNDIEILQNRMFYYLQNNLFRQAYKDVLKLAELQPAETKWKYIQGLCLNNLGYCMDAVKCFQSVIDMDPNYKEAYTNMSVSYRDWSNYSKSFEVLRNLAAREPEYTVSYSLKGLLHYLLGNAAKAVENYQMVLRLDELKGVSDNLETMYTCAIANQSMGKFRAAAELFNKILLKNPKHYAYYQREICYYLHRRLNEPIEKIQMDVDIMPNLKEVIAKRSPFEEFERVIANYTHQTRQSSDNIPDITNLEIQTMGNSLARDGALLDYIDKLGAKIQYKNPGFISNKRQHRMAGLAILDAVWLFKENIQQVKNKGTGTGAGANGGGAGAGAAIKPLTWRKFMDIIVRWRQISEPNDPVWWIDLLTRESYEVGFGLQTPLWGGQLKIPRYYPYFPYALQIMKQYTLEQYPHTAEMRKLIENATECGELREIMGNDYFVIVPCKSSIANRAHTKNMEGTRLTIVKKGLDSYDFMIRTPVTPARWAEFNEELSNIWIQISIELFKEKQFRDGLKLMGLFIRFYYYWACFAPLSRGTAAVGYTALIALFMMMDIEIQPNLPELKQIDWEAILKNDFDDFNREVYQWIVNDHMKVINQLPNIQPYIQTYRQRLCALNTRIPNLEE